MPANNINLLERVDFEKTPLGKFLRWAFTYGRYIIVSTEIIVLLAFIYRFSLDRKITDLNEEISQKSSIIQANQKFEVKFRNLQNRINQIGSLISAQNAAVLIIKHMESLVPTGVSFRDFTITGNVFTITAVASTNSSFAQFINRLKDSPVLTQVNVSTLNKNSAETGNIEFLVEAQLKTQ